MFVFVIFIIVLVVHPAFLYYITDRLQSVNGWFSFGVLYANDINIQSQSNTVLWKIWSTFVSNYFLSISFLLFSFLNFLVYVLICGNHYSILSFPFPFLFLSPLSLYLFFIFFSFFAVFFSFAYACCTFSVHLYGRLVFLLCMCTGYSTPCQTRAIFASITKTHTRKLKKV